MDVATVGLNTNLMDTWLVENHHKTRVNLGESSINDLRLGELFPEIDRILRVSELTLGNNSTWGSQRLRSRVADTYPGVGPEQVLVTAGVSEAIAALSFAHLEHGANMVIPVPAFHALIDVPARLGYEIRPVPLQERSEFRLRVADVIAALDAHTRIVLLNSPHNPTGVVYEHDDILQIADAARAVGAVVIVDEHYRYLIHEGSEQYVRSAAGARENIVALGSVGKCFGCTGIRVGWIIAAAARLQIYHHYKLLVTHTIPVLSDHIAAEILERREALQAATRASIVTNLHMLQDFAGVSANGLRLYPPQAGGVAFVKLERIANTFEFAQALLDDYGILVLPGESFDMPGFLRLRLGVPPEQFAQACAALESALFHYSSQRF